MEIWRVVGEEEDELEKEVDERGGGRGSGMEI